MQNMVAAVSTPFQSKSAAQRGPHQQNPTRPPLLPSEPDNALPSRRSKSREVTSRYMSSSSTSSSSSVSRRCPSPLVSRTASSTTITTPIPSAKKRSQSVERRRTATPRPYCLDFKIVNGYGGGVDLSASQKLLPSTRSLSVSFQGESFSLRVSKAKPAPTPSVRKGTPERRKATTPAGGGSTAVDQTENSSPITDQHCLPGRLRQANNCMSRSLDCADASKKECNGSGKVVRALHDSMVDDRDSIDSKLSSNSDNAEPEKVTKIITERNSATISDSESASSGSNCGVQECVRDGEKGQQGGPRGIVVPARFLQEASNRLRRQLDPGSPSSKNVVTKNLAPKLFVPKKIGIDNPGMSPRRILNSRGQSSPIRCPLLSGSPSRLSTSSVSSSPLRGTSPSRMRNAVGNSVSSNFGNTSSILTFGNDIRKAKIGENKIDAHLLRILYNRLLQWRFVNARSDAALSAQRLNAERSLYNARISALKLRESVRAKRCEFHLLRQKLKLTSILKWQMIYLEEWDLVDEDFSNSLSVLTEALRASTLRLPVVGGAKADAQSVKYAISSAVDVMQAMASSTCLLLSKVNEVNYVVSELANVSAKERGLLEHCKDLLSTAAAMQVKENSLRTHILQLECGASSPNTQM